MPNTHTVSNEERRGVKVKCWQIPDFVSDSQSIMDCPMSKRCAPKFVEIGCQELNYPLITRNVRMNSGALAILEEKNDKVPLLPEKRQDAEKSEYTKASFSGAVFNLSTTIVGAGIMALPATMKVLGLIPGLCLIVLLGFLTNFSIEILLKFSKAGKAISYGDVMADAFGRLGRILSQISIIINNLGILIVYMIIIGDVISGTSSNGVHHAGVLEEWFGVCWWTGRTGSLLLTTILILVPLVSFRHVADYAKPDFNVHLDSWLLEFTLEFVLQTSNPAYSLKFTSALSMALAVVFVVITAGITIVKLFSGNIHMPRLLPNVDDQASFLKLFTVVPVIVTAYICHYNVHPIHNELENASEMQGIVQMALILCSTIYIATSFFGYLLFGDQTMDDVLANFDRNLGVPYSVILNDIVRISYAIHLMLVFPLIHFALRLNLDGLIFPSARPLTSDTKRFVLITSGLVGVAFLGATFIPSIWVAFQFTGATAAVCLGFIFPGAIALRDTHGISTRKDKSVALTMIVLAVISCSIAVSSDIYDLLKKNDMIPSPPQS
eukprot:Gb_00075 [translate_table: standard]